MSRDKQIIGEWKFDEEIHSDLWNSDDYRTITFESDVVDEQTYEGLAYLARREALREVLICANPNLAISVAGGIEAATYLANAILAAGYVKASDVAEEILKEVRELYMIDDRYAALERIIKKKYIGKDTNVTTKESGNNNE